MTSRQALSAAAEFAEADAITTPAELEAIRRQHELFWSPAACKKRRIERERRITEGQFDVLRG